MRRPQRRHPITLVDPDHTARTALLRNRRNVSDQPRVEGIVESRVMDALRPDTHNPVDARRLPRRRIAKNQDLSLILI